MKKIVVILSCLLSVLIVTLVVFGIVVYSEYQKALEQVVNREMLFWKEEDNLCFTNPNKASSGFKFDTVSGKIKQIVSDVDYKYIKYEDEKLRFVKDLQKGIYCLNKESGEIFYLFDMQKEKKNDGYADGFGITDVNVSNMYNYNGKLYYSQSISIRTQDNSETVKAFFSFDPLTNKLTEISVPENILGRDETKNVLYFVQSENEEKILKSFDINTGEITEIVDSLGSVIYNVYPYEYGIYYLSSVNGIDDFTLNTYNTSTGESNRIDLPSSLVTGLLYSEKEDIFFCFFANNNYCVLDSDLKNEVNLKQIPKDKNEYAKTDVSPMIELNGKIYFAKYNSYGIDDAYVVYGMDADGNLETVKKQETSFMNKILLIIAEKEK